MNSFKLKWMVFLYAFLSGIVYSQETREKTPVHCFSDQLISEQLRSNPRVQHQANELEMRVRTYLEDHKGPHGNLKSSSANLIIPVVVYVVHQNGPENISDVQVMSQINALNAYFDNYGIQFCLATKKGSQQLLTMSTPSGVTSTTAGIFHYYSPTLTNHNVTQQAALTATGSALPADSYLRIWVVKGITSNTLPPGQKILGYSMLPEFAQSATDGIVMSYDAFGDVSSCACTTLASYSQQGKTLVHEAGHYLGLYHTFNGGCQGMNAGTCATDGDMVCDTPPVQTPNSGCPVATWNTCSETPDLPDNIHNYMDYVSESCMNNFTNGQSDRIMAHINLFRGNLVSSTNHVYTGIGCTGGLSATFTASNYMPCIGSSVTFNAISVAGATYSWDFGDGTTATGVSVTHTYSSAYDPASVVLTVTNGSNSVSSTSMLFVGNCQPLQNTQGHWYFGQRGGLNFASGGPVYDNNAYTHNNGIDEACAVQSDASGNLLFYTNGIFVWNNNHAAINAGNLLLSDLSAHRGALIVPNPGNTSEYYLFTRDGGSYEDINMLHTVPGPDGFRYSIVNVTGGAASVTSNWNVPVTMPSSYGYDLGNNNALMGGEGITAIKSCNGYWILTSGKKGSAYFITVFSLTNSGLSFVAEYPCPFNASQISFEVSPDGRYLAVGSGTRGSLEVSGLAIYDFDPITGVISNQKILNNLYTYGMAFSPDSKLLYATSWSDAHLRQYDVTSATPATTGISVSTNSGYSCELQLGPDGRIYMTSNSMKVQVIHKPNVRVTTSNPNACVYSPNGVLMQTTLSYSLPNMVDANQAGVFTNTIISERVSCLAYKFKVNMCAATYSWNFGDPASGSGNTSTAATPTHTFSGPGTYVVSVTGNSTTYTTTVTVGIAAVISGSPTICPANGMTGNYSANLQPGQTAVWSVSGGGISGLNNQSDVTVIWTSLPGTVTLTLTDAAGCTSTTSMTVTQNCQTPCNCTLAPSFTYTLDPSNCTATFTGASGGPACLQNVTYHWYVDNVPYTGSTISHAFTQAGAHVVCLTVSASNGQNMCEQAFCDTIYTSCPQTCNCSLNPSITYDYDGTTCTIYLQGDPGGDPCLQNVAYTWTIDGNVYTGNTLTYTFTQPGVHLICLKVKADNGIIKCENTTCINVTSDCQTPCECNLDPVILYDYDQTSCTIKLEGQSGGNSCLQNVTYTWTIDGNPYSGNALTYTFNQPGIHTICLNVTADNGIVKCEKSTCIQVESNCSNPCNCQLSPSFTYTIDKEKCVVKLEGQSGADPCLQNVTYTWQIDGNTYTGQNIDYTLPQSGVYLVCLTVTATNGGTECTQTICKKVKANCTGCGCTLKPEFKYEVDPKTCIYKFFGNANAPDCQPLVEYYWDFGDGNSSMGQNPSHIYNAPGTYKVCMKVVVFDSKGNILCDDYYCEEIVVDCSGACKCELNPTYTYTKTGSCLFLFNGDPGSECTDLYATEWVVNGNVVAVNQQHLLYQFDVNTSYEVCFVVHGNVNGDMCEAKYCEQFFYTDCYMFKNGSDDLARTDSENGLTLFPNPATSEVQLQFSELPDAEIAVTIRSAEGKIVGTAQFDKRQQVSLQIPESLANGIVLIEVKTGDKVYIRRLIITGK